MARIQQSIDVQVPVHAAYSSIARVEDFPRFMQDVEAVQRLDDTHLHWLTISGEQPVEWDAEITEQSSDRCIAWQDVRDPGHAGRIEVQQVGTEAARVVMTLEGNNAQEQRLEQDLVRLKKMLEGARIGASAGDASTRTEAGLAAVPDEAADQGRFTVAEEMAFDQQPDQARRVGQPPQDIDNPTARDPGDAMAKSLEEGGKDGDAQEKLKQSIERSVPPAL